MPLRRPAAGGEEQGHLIDPEDPAHISPYLAKRIRRSANTPPMNSAFSPRRTTHT
ncbi:hypothetical protein ACFU53_07540 [Streptomyces sp. NPDC057474]|uniref:hypothetical protein n=1 Tax=Streptomyces sp. NPDC057474 TaxID=3346144 RepID=UPI0036C16916